MKTDIHPDYHPDAQVTCACGNTWTTGSTSAELRVALCSNCHPFYTGEQRIVDTEGRVERLMRRFNLGSAEEAARMAEETAERSAAAEAEKKQGRLPRLPCSLENRHRRRMLPMNQKQGRPKQKSLKIPETATKPKTQTNICRSFRL